MSLPKHNHILRTTTTTNKQTSKQTNKQPKRSEIEKWKTRGHIMKFQNKKLEKERERQRQRNLRSKNDNVLRGTTFGMVGYDCLRVSTFVTVGYDFALALGYNCLRVSEWVWEGGVKGCSCFRVWTLRIL